MAFSAFMATPAGRSIRILVGIALIVIGLAAVEGTPGWIIAAVGVLPIALGAFNVCLIALVLGAPFSGRDAQERHKRATL